MTAPAIQRRSLPPSTAAVQRAGALAAAKLGFDTNPFVGIEYTPAFIAFAAYLVAIITFRFPIGTVSMSIALFTLMLEKQPLRLPGVATLSIALVAWALLGTMTTQYPNSVIDAVSEFAKVCAVIFVACNVIVTRARFRAVTVGIIILYVLFPLRGTIFAFFIYHGDVQGRAAWNYIYSNPNDLAGLCLLQLSVAIGVLAVERRAWVRHGTKFAIGLLVLVIVLTQSRGAIIALGAFGLIGGRKYFRSIRAVLSVLALAGLVYLIAPDSVWRRFSTIKTATSTEAMDPDLVDADTRSDQSSSQQRLAIWKVATEIVKENFFMGVGLGAYPDAHNVVSQRPGFDPLARGFRDTHSTYLNVLAETGIVGFVLFASMIITTLVSARRARLKMSARAPALSLQLFNMEVGLYGYLVAAIWGSYGALVPTYVHLVLMYVCSTLLLEYGESVQPTQGRRSLYPMATPQRVSAVVNRRMGASL